MTRRRKPQPQTTAEPSDRRTAYGRWFMQNVRREIAAGRVRSTVGDDGEPVTIH